MGCEVSYVMYLGIDWGNLWPRLEFVGKLHFIKIMVE